MLKGFTRLPYFVKSRNKTSHRVVEAHATHSLTFIPELYLGKKKLIERKLFQSKRETAVTLPLKQPTLVRAVPLWVNRRREMRAAMKARELSD